MEGLPSLSTPQIILIGDAVHPLPPSSFQGGSQSIEDGAALAICLALSGGSRNDVPRALRAFEQLRKPRVAEALETGKQVRAHAALLGPARANPRRRLTAALHSHRAATPPLALLAFYRSSRLSSRPAYRQGL